MKNIYILHLFIINTAKLITSVFVLFYLGSCAPDFDLGNFKAPEWNPNIAVPLISAKLTVGDILKKTGNIDFFKNNKDSSLSLFHGGQILSPYGYELVKYEDQSKDTTISILFPINLSAGDSLIQSYTVKQNFLSSKGDRLDSAWMRGGAFDISFESMMPHDARVVIYSPYITKGGVPLRQVFNLTYTGTLPIIESKQVNLSGYNFYFSNTGGNSYLSYNVDVVLYGDSNPSAGPFPIKAVIEQKNIEYDALFGFIEQRSIASLSDTIEIDIFKKSLGGDFWINNPSIGINIRNSFGTPVSASVDPVIGISDIKSPYKVLLTGSGLPVPLTVNTPAFAYPRQFANTNVYIDKTNSNLAALLNLLPHKIIYNIDADLNPTGVAKSFILRDSRLEVNFEVELPLEGYASGFTMENTLEFEVNEDVDYIEWLVFRIFTKSTFPVETALQIVFLDSSYKPLDSLFAAHTAIIPGANPGPPPTYKSVNPVSKIIDISLPASKIANISGKTRYIKVSGALQTGGGGNKIAKIYTDNYLDFKIGVQTKLNLELSDMQPN